MPGARFYEFGPFRLDVVERQLSRDGQPVALTDKVFELLLLLVQNAGHALTKAELMQRIWPDTVVEENNLTVSMSFLRKALGESPASRRYVETLPRRGYRFIAPVTTRDSVPAAPALASAELARAAATPPPPPPSAVTSRPFVGREWELQELERRLAEAASARGKLVLVTGAPGMGKTELCDQLTSRARQRGSWLVASGHCFEHHGASEPYSPFIEVLGALLGGEDGERVRAALERHAPTWAGQFSTTQRQLDPKTQRDTLREGDGARMLREFADLLERLSRIRPLLLVLEDLHWADPASADLLRVLAHRAGGTCACIVATLRGEQADTDNAPLRNVRRELLAHGLCDELALPLFDGAALTAYIDAQFAPHDLPRAFAELIARRTEGHPLFATRLLQLLAERGDVQRVDGRFVLARPLAELELGVPDNVRGLIERKFESLPPEQRRTLQYASVLGVEFSCSALSALLQEDEISVDERLDELARRHRVLELAADDQLVRGAPTTRYRFAHVLYQNVLYDALASQRRMLLHGKVAEQLLEQSAGQTQRPYAQLALHFERARDFRRALDFWMRAADEASRLYADVQAAEHYAHALELVERLEPEQRVGLRIIVLYNNAWCWSKLGDETIGRRDFTAMLHAASAPEFAGASVAAERARAEVFDFFEQPWRDAFGVYDMPRMPNQPRSLGAAAIQCEAYWGLSYTLAESDRLDELRACVDDYLSLAERTLNEPRRAEALAWKAVLECKLANFREVMRLADESIALCRALGHRRPLHMIYLYQAGAYYFQAKYEAARALLEESLELTFEAESKVAALLQMAKTCAQLGAAAEARAALGEATEIAQRKALDGWLLWVAGAAGDVHRELGDYQRALAEHTRACELARQSGLLLSELDALFGACASAVEAGELDRAREAFARAQSLEEKRNSEGGPDHPNPLAVLRFEFERNRAAALLHQALGELDAAAHDARRLLDSRNAASPLTVATARYLLARIALARGRSADAAREAASGLAAIAAGHSPVLRARLTALAAEAAGACEPRTAPS